jgi:hypothetical protein
MRELHLGVEQTLFAGAQFLLCPFAVGHVDDKHNSFVLFSLEKRSAD